MIRREVGNEFFLIAQHDHAILSGELAQHFGNERFARPQPWEPVIAAARLHDCGWPLHDDEPTLNPRHLPLDVFESPRAVTLKVWTASAERAAAVHPYAGLLVSLHSLALSILVTSQTNPQHEKLDTMQLTERFEINKFQHREVERQEQLRSKLGMRTDLPLTHGLAAPRATEADDQLIFNFRMLQAMDLLSLCLCCTHAPADKTQDVLTDPGAPAVQLKMVRRSEEMLLVDPWPFSSGRIDLTVPLRRIPRREYRDEGDLRQTVKTAPILQLPFVLAAG
jgi:hypothetical protein